MISWTVALFGRYAHISGADCHVHDCWLCSTLHINHTTSCNMVTFCHSYHRHSLQSCDKICWLVRILLYAVWQNWMTCRPQPHNCQMCHSLLMFFGLRAAAVVAFVVVVVVVVLVLCLSSGSGGSFLSVWVLVSYLSSGSVGRFISVIW